jgi:anaerobic dimethyl sulfoxide reductase subunit B (iron-sulfur subunit)
MKRSQKRRLAFFFDASACSGCKTCQIACKDHHDLPIGQLWRRVYEIAGGGWRTVNGVWSSKLCVYHLSMSCNHCEKPACVEVCPEGAAKKRDDGIVLIDPEICSGCRACESACPFEAPQFDVTRGVMGKCDFCVDRIDNGRTPVCVAACPMRALEVGELDDLQSQYGAALEIHPFEGDRDTVPALVVKSHPSLEQVQGKGVSVINREEIGSESR